MGQDALTKVADVVLQQVRNSGSTIAEGDLLVSLPVYLDATEVHLLQMEVNRRSGLYVELQHRPGERRVGVPSVLIWSETDPRGSLMYEGEEAH
jgi:hypothetical protein